MRNFSVRSLKSCLYFASCNRSSWLTSIRVFSSLVCVLKTCVGPVEAFIGDTQRRNQGEIPKGPAMLSSPVPLAFQETEWQEGAEAKPPWVLKTAGRMGLCPFFTAPSLPLCPPRSTTEGGSVLEPGYLGSSGQWDMMRPQKGSISGDLSSGSSKYQLHSKPTDLTRSGPQNPDFSSIRNLFIRCLLTTVPWSCGWHVLELGLQGLPQPLTEVSFLPTLSPWLLTLGGQTFHMPLSCKNRSSSTNLGLEPPEQLT
ncbi:hypothetical protein MJG53_001620 [Ovis ammon polii x Ovis aries]|uniref:Uncharacterized protein n=1 Tax=Ovis ammon polii x Ovis aries TaxID=2918886 RepID=A0ACB9VM90_9CETA|nr:hypothetical protein MJG53_001620 [Ovis ammon polii x Ovis aries]